MTRPRYLRRAGIVIAAALVCFTVIFSSSPAAARWIRGADEPNVASDDVAICESGLVFETEYAHEAGFFNDDFPGYVAEIGVSTYPAGPDVFNLYATEQAAIDAGSGGADNPVVTIETALVLESLGDPNEFEPNVFRGTTIVPAPPGSSDGDQLWAVQVDGANEVTDPVAFTVGASEYDCADTLDIDLLARQDRVRIGAPWPVQVSYDLSGISSQGITASANNGTVKVPVQHLYVLGGRGYGEVDLRAAGIDCDTTSITVEGIGLDDASTYRGFHPVAPRGSGCLS